VSTSPCLLSSDANRLEPATPTYPINRRSNTNHIAFAEYLWIDGDRPTQQIRSKARVVSVPNNPEPSDFSGWSFDGSSTGQASGDFSDCLLEPVRVYNDPFRGEGNYLVLCEVNDADGKPQQSNQRAHLRDILSEVGISEDPWLGFEQE